MTRRTLPKYDWYVLTPNNHPAGVNPRRHAVAPGSNGEVKALCGGEPESASYQISGPKTLEKHPICGRCLAQINRSVLMLGSK